MQGPITFPLFIRTPQELGEIMVQMASSIAPDIISFSALAKERNTTPKTIGQKVKAAKIRTVQLGKERGIYTKDKNRIS